MTEAAAHTICTLITEIDELKAENLSLKTQLDTTRDRLATANAALHNYRRTGW